MLVFHATVIGSLSAKGVAVSGRQGLFRRHWSWHQWIILSVACSPTDQFPVACLASVSRIFCFKWLNAWNSSSLQIKLATTLCIPNVNLTWSGLPGSQALTLRARHKQKLPHSDVIKRTQKCKWIARRHFVGIKLNFTMQIFSMHVWQNRISGQIPYLDVMSFCTNQKTTNKVLKARKDRAVIEPRWRHVLQLRARNLPKKDSPIAYLIY